MPIRSEGQTDWELHDVAEHHPQPGVRMMARELVETRKKMLVLEEETTEALRKASESVLSVRAQLAERAKDTERWDKLSRVGVDKLWLADGREFAARGTDLRYVVDQIADKER